MLIIFATNDGNKRAQMEVQTTPNGTIESLSFDGVKVTRVIELSDFLAYEWGYATDEQLREYVCEQMVSSGDLIYSESDGAYMSWVTRAEIAREHAESREHRAHESRTDLFI